MATSIMHAVQLIAAVAALSVGGSFAVSAQQPTTTPSVSGFSLSRPEFTRPAGIPGAARASANEQYLLAPAQPADPAAPRKRKKH